MCACVGMFFVSVKMFMLGQLSPDHYFFNNMFHYWACVFINSRHMLQTWSDVNQANFIWPYRVRGRKVSIYTVVSSLHALEKMVR